MPPVVIYTTSSCPYCHAAKDLLRQKGAEFQEISVDGDRAGRAAMTAKAGGRSMKRIARQQTPHRAPGSATAARQARQIGG